MCKKRLTTTRKKIKKIKVGIINSKAKAEQVENFDIEFLDGSINVGVKNK